MKTFSVQKLGLLAAFALFCCTAVSAQEQRKVTIIKKGNTEDGSTMIVKNGRAILGIYPDESSDVKGIVISSVIEDKGAQLAGLKDGDVITIVDGQAVDGAHDLRTALVSHKPGDEVKVEFLRDGKNSVAIVKLSGEDNKYAWNAESFATHRDPCKVFIGVGTNSVSGGLEVDYTVENTPATASGVKAGDIILALDGVPVGTQTELVRERDKHQPGDAFTLSIERAGQRMDINARFKECSEEELAKYQEQQEAHKMDMARFEERMKEMQVRMDEMFANGEMTERLAKLEKQERPILGVYEDESVNAQGLLIGTVIQGKGAEAAGLKAGDLVTVVDGKTITGTGTLRAALTGHKPGDRVPVVFQRGGQTLQADVVLSAGHNVFSYTIERDPCAVFIGVYTSDLGAGEQGVRVTGIVDDTPAKQSGVQPGDIILSLDGVAVNTNTELRVERDKHRPGELFQLAILRDGAYLTIDATFKSCLNPSETTTEINEVVELADNMPAADRNDPVSQLDATLQLTSLELFPNPTVGPLNVRFEAEAVPTVVTIRDIAGKTVYTNNLNQFNGSFNELVNLFGNKPGTYVLSIQQGDKVCSRTFVLMPRA